MPTGTPGGELGALKPEDLRSVVFSYRDQLARHAPGLDSLDPTALDAAADAIAADGVGADGVGAAPHAGDTGSNLLATVTHACSAVTRARGDMASLAAAMVPAAAGVRGRSGRRIAAVMAGIADVVRNADTIDGERFAMALDAAADAAAECADEAPGAMAAVVRTSADAALAAADLGGSLADVVAASCDAGMSALEDGATSSAALARHGVVDAGGAGVLLFLDAVFGHVTGEPLAEPPPGATDGLGADGIPDGYEVRFRLEAGEAEVSALRSAWSELGAEGTAAHAGHEVWRCAVRVLGTVDLGPAIEAILAVGSPTGLRVDVVGGGPTELRSTGGRVKSGEPVSPAAVQEVGERD